MADFSYDKSSPESILSHARLLLGKSIRNLHPSAKLYSDGKGGLGQTIEKYHFGYMPNDDAAPDFAEAGVELKCLRLKELRDGSMVSRDRLVLNIINYMEEYSKTFETSSFTHKNALLLLMFCLHVHGVSELDFLFKIIRLWQIPEEDLKIFIDDWTIIHDKIVNGLAHELSEGDTLYLAACRKGKGHDGDKRSQPGSSTLADQRAYSIKIAYLNHIILDSISHTEMVDGVTMTLKQRRAIEKKKGVGSIVKSIKDYRQGETFEQLVKRRFTPFIGMSVRAIAKKLNATISTSPKAISYSICRAILGVKELRIAEFEKADLQLKTIRLEPNGNLKEAMSFQSIKYKEIINEEDWNESDWYRTIATQRFLFIVFRKVKNGSPSDAVLERVFFWAMPQTDIDSAEAFWRDTRDKVRAGDYTHFIKSSEHPVCHVRPKAKNAEDTTDTPQGGKAKKLCYWLNRNYILGVVKKNMSPIIPWKTGCPTPHP